MWKTPGKMSCFNGYKEDVFVFVAAIITFTVAIVVVFILCIHTKSKTLVASLASQQIKGINTFHTHEYLID